MKVAVVGTGKTGSEVVKLIANADLVGPFNRQTPPTMRALEPADVCVVFTPGEALTTLIPLMIEAKQPVIWGSTGYEWPSDLDDQLRTAGLTWIHGENFSLGMALVQRLLRTLDQGYHLLDSPDFHLHDLHHAKKRDAPSGTAKAWNRSLSERASLTSTREADHPGTHTLTINTPHETIILEHKSKQRSMYAQGALWAAKKLSEGTIPAGFHHFGDLL